MLGELPEGVSLLRRILRLAGPGPSSKSLFQATRVASNRCPNEAPSCVSSGSPSEVGWARAR